MSRPDFKWMSKELLRNGVSPRIASRAVIELREHYEDLEAEARSGGIPSEAAMAQASERLGNPDMLVRQISSRVNLKSWIYRYPAVARVALPAVCVLILPVAPLFAGVAHLSSIMRWMACFLLSGLLTATLMLILQLSITHS